MRKNLPVKNEELFMKDGQLIVTRTDKKGLITYANQDFVDISGFSEAELLGAPHNIVRHPDMPEAAFKDLWDTVKNRKPWVGIVKNRTRSGSFYWVKATVTTLQHGAEIIGYMSVRNKPSREEVEAADNLYRQINAGGAKNIYLQGGVARERKSMFGKALGLLTRSLRARMVTVVGIMAAAALGVGVIGLSGMSSLNDRMGMVYEEGLIPMHQLSQIKDLMRDNMEQLMSAAGDGADLKGGAQQPGRLAHVQRIRANMQNITAIWQAFMAGNQTASEKQLALAYQAERSAYESLGLQPGLEMIEKGQSAELNKHIQTNVLPRFEKTNSTADRLMAFEQQNSAAQYAASGEKFHTNLIMIIAALGFSLIVGFIIYRATMAAITVPVKKLVDCFGFIANGKYDNIIQVEEEDELGSALQRLNAMQVTLAFERDEKAKLEKDREADREARILAEEAARAEKEAEQDRRHREQDAKAREMTRLMNEFDHKIAEVLKSVDVASGELEQYAGRMNTIAENTSLRSQAVAAASDEAAANVQTVASAAEELSSSIHEINRQVNQSAQVTETAVDKANRTNETVRKLENSAEKIGQVVSLISEIASQTNLLALNATIEAARAGESGKGFAVVASEVKNLANQTAQATEDISAQVGEMQSVTIEAVKAIEEIIDTIREVRDVATAISAAVEEQGAATQEIARNVQEASNGTTEVSSNISGVTSSAAETGSTASQVLNAVEALNNQSKVLRQEVDGFFALVKAV
jgi:aerotaxis receptor